MFWRKKKSVDSAKCPSVDDIDGFVEWLLRYGGDFADYRDGSQCTLSRYVRDQAANVHDVLGAHGDADGLAANMDASMGEYQSDFKERVATAGSFQNLPSHLHAKAFPFAVKLRVLMYVLQHRHDRAPSASLLSLLGPLRTI